MGCHTNAPCTGMHQPPHQQPSTHDPLRKQGILPTTSSPGAVGYGHCSLATGHSMGAVLKPHGSCAPTCGDATPTCRQGALFPPTPFLSLKNTLPCPFRFPFSFSLPVAPSPSCQRLLPARTHQTPNNAPLKQGSHLMYAFSDRVPVQIYPPSRLPQKWLTVTK